MFAFLFITFLIVVFIIAVYYYYNKNKELTNGGYMISRPWNFLQLSQTYYLSGADYGQVYKEVLAGDYSKVGVRILHNDSAEVLLFKGATWNGRLVHKEDTASRNVYEFRFTSWKTTRGSTQYVNDMNMVLTQVEKALLRIDYDADVVAKMIETKTKSSVL